MSQNECVTNVIENTACHVARLQSGRLAPHHLMPYLPVSLNMLCARLDEMVDGAAVLSETHEGIREYIFTAYTDQPPARTILGATGCMGCSMETISSSDVLCVSCAKEFQKELSVLAEKSGWPAQAVYEHEILYLASQEKGAIAAETLAGASRYTLRSMKKKLAAMMSGRFVNEEPGDRAGTKRYEFPALNYPKNRYRSNQRLIRSYPASMMEDVEQRLVRILFVLGMIFLTMIGLAFWGIPFVLLMPAFVVVAPITAVLIWRHKNKLEEI